MKPTDAKFKSAKPKDRPFKLYDTDGLYLLINPNDSRWWRFRYRYAGRDNALALGTYPKTSLRAARAKRDEARKLLNDGRDPAAERKAGKLARRTAAENSFEALGREWLARQDVAPATAVKNRWLLEELAFPYIGRRPIAEIGAPELLAMLRRMESRGKLETAQRLKNKVGQVIRYAIATGRAVNDPTASLRGALKTPKTRHHAAVTEPKRIGELLRAIDGYGGQFETLCALKLAPLVFVRPGELRRAEWQEIDVDAAEWRIPGEKMKMGAPHIVPLSQQAVAVLREILPLTGHGRYVFPAVRGAGRPMSENTLNAALRRLGYGADDMTAHGFRSMAATRLNEMGFRADAIERQLAHAESNKVRDAYTAQAQYLDERRTMMQAWADYLDGLRTGADVLTLRRKAS